MNCPNCGKEYAYGSSCPYCGMDTVLYTGTTNISNSLYNKALAKLKVSDLSTAKDCLLRSISFDKNNTQARNLLGLIQYETGHIGEALKNWVISCGLQKENNQAAAYIETIQKNARALERLNDAVRIYNQALNDLRQKSDDMAIIKLKQAADLNPKFIDALNLLSFCYLIQKDKAKAQATIERTLAIDTNNTTALSYYNEINPTSRIPAMSKANRRRPSAQTAPAESTAPYKKVVLHERRNVNFHIEGILALVIGVVCTLGVLYVLVFPALDRTHAAQIDDAHTRLEQAHADFEALLNERDEEITHFETLLEQSNANVQSWESRYDTLERTFGIFHAHELLRENRHREAVDILGGIDMEGLPTDISERATEIRQVAYPILASRYYNEGVTAYNARDFEKARVDFERAYRYAMHGEPAFYGEVIYYLAFTHSQDGMDTELAIHYFERLLEEFPGHARTVPARNRLNAIS